MAIVISDENIFEEIHQDLISHGFGMIYFRDEYCGVYLNDKFIVAAFHTDIVDKCVRIMVMPEETDIKKILDTYALKQSSTS